MKRERERKREKDRYIDRYREGEREIDTRWGPSAIFNDVLDRE